jgi:hypothetical protein
VLINTDSQQHSLHSVQTFKKGEVLCNFFANKIYSEANCLTIQIGADTHISLLPEFLQYTNHSCNPNIFFDTVKMEVLALRDIEINDELCFFYPSTEWKMAQSFLCFCGSNSCLQNISGAADLKKEVLKRFRLTDFIHSMVDLNNG